MVGEVDDALLQLLGRHLAVAHHHARVGHHALYHGLKRRQLVDAVVDEKHLSVARQLEVDGLGHHLVVERADGCEYGVAVGRRRGDGAKVARAHQRELQGARNGRGRHGERVHIHFELLQLLLHAHAKLLLLIDHQQAKVVEFHRFANQLVGAYHYVHLALGQIGQQLLHLLGLAGAGKVVHLHREVFEALLKRVVVLEGEHRGGHKHGGLLAVGGGLEGGANGDFGLAEAHVAAYQAVHGLVLFHVGLHGLRGLKLVGGVLVDERRLQLVLQVSVGRIGVTLFAAALGIELYEVAGNVFQLALGAALQFVPRARAEFAQARLHTLLAAVFRQLVQGVYRHEYYVAVEVGELYHLLARTVDGGAHQAAKLAYAVVLVHYVVAHLNLVEFLERQCKLARARLVALEVVFVEAVEYLVVGEHAQFQVVVHKSLVHGAQHGRERNLVASVVEYGAQAVDLPRAVAENSYVVAARHEVGERRAYQVEVLVVYALRRAVQPKAGVAALRALAVVQVDAPHCGKRAAEGCEVDHLAHGVDIGFAGNHRAGRHLLLAHGLHALQQPVGIAAHHHGVGAGKLKQRGARRSVAVGAAHQAHRGLLCLAELRLHVEGAYAFYVISEKVDAVGQLVAVGIHIEYRAAHGKLPRLVHIVNLGETQLAQAGCRGGEVGGAAGLQAQRAGLHACAVGHLLGQGLGIAHHPLQVGIAVPLVEHFGAQYGLRRIGLAILDVALVARGEYEHVLLAIDLAQVVVDVSRLIEVVGHHQIGARETRQAREEHRCRRACKAIDTHQPVGRVGHHRGQGLGARLGVEQVAQLAYWHLFFGFHFHADKAKKVALLLHIEYAGILAGLGEHGGGLVEGLVGLKPVFYGAALIVVAF